MDNGKTYTWAFAKKADKQFQKLDKQIQRRIVKWLDEHIEGANDPRVWGKSLDGDWGTYWRYRVGAFRIIADIHDDLFIVEVVKTGKRGQVYDRY